MSSAITRCMSNLNETIEVLKSVESKGAFAFVAVTKQDGLKKSRVTKAPTPARFELITVVKAATVSLGNDYQAAVNNRLTKEGKDADFEAQATYCAPVSDNKLVYKHNDRDSFYLRVYPNLCVSFKTVVRRFDAFGVAISDSEWPAIQAEYFKVPSKNENQGLDNPIIVNNYSLENVKYLKRGEILIDDLTAEIVAVTKAA